MKKLRLPFLPVVVVLTTLFSAGPADAGPFTPGNIAVLRAGEGAAALSSAATAAFIDEYTPAGALVQSIPIPAAAGTPLTLAGSANSEGGLMRSPNGALLCFAGYRASAGTATVATTTAAVVNRGIGTMDVNGTFALAATTGSQFSGASIRSAATDGANNFWGGGNSNPVGTGGVNYFGTEAIANQLLSANLRWVNHFNGELYFSSGSMTPGTGIHQFTGSPVVAAVSTPLTVVADQSPYGFSINPGGTAMYVADDRATTNGGGIQRWNKAGAVWSLAYTLGTGGGSTVGTRGLAVNWSAAVPVVFATTTETSNRLITVADTGPVPLPVPTTVASAGANKAFRGVAFAPIPTRVPKPRFFASNLLPPPNGVYVSEPGDRATYANGIRIRNVSQKGFSRSLPPPPLGSSQMHTFSANTEMDVSNDGGVTFQHFAAPTNVTFNVMHTSDAATTSFFDTEMLQLDITGGGLPPGIMIRESPTRASTGRTTTKPEGAGYMIDSFFDIFTEISLDGGQTWVPAADPLQVELSMDPLSIASIPTPTNLLPPPNDFYASTSQFFVLFPQGVVIRDVKHQFFTQSLPAPPPGGSQVQTFDSQFDMEVSQNGGQTFLPVRVPAAASMRVTRSRDEGTTQIYDTEMLSLNLMGGGLPVGVMLRESPTRRSQGGTAMTPQPDGTYRVHSFFDIFTELSLDGGQNWSPAASSPGHLELQCVAPEVVEPTLNLPPPGDQYAGIGSFDLAFASGIILKDTTLSQFTQSLPPPPPGGSQIHAFQTQVKFRISQDGGVTFQPGAAPASCVINVRSSTDVGSTRFFDTEMLSLNIEGGTLQNGVKLRESPGKASLGRTSVRQTPPDGGFKIASFFDIFVELSLDGGAAWQPQITQPTAVVLQKSPKPHLFPTNVLPPPGGMDVSSAGAPFATYANGIIIQNVSRKRPTQGLPPPPPGGSQVHNSGSTVEMDVSNDRGATFQHISAPAALSERVTRVSGDAMTNCYDTEMLALNISGGGLPAGVMLRESPSKASLGRTTIAGTGGGYMIDSFFDIFTEISLDGGQVWSPSAASGRVELGLDATAIPPIPAPTILLPPPNDFYASTSLLYALFAQGIVIRDVKHHFFSPSLPAPPLGQSMVHTFDGQVDMQISSDGGQTFQTTRAPSALSMRVTHTRDEGTTQIFDTEMLQLDIQGGGLPAGVILRESPTRQSQGGTAIAPQADGTYHIHSFFDIFTELTVDGGQNWSPASAPAHVELQCTAPEVTGTSPNLPPPGGAYASNAAVDALFPGGVIVKETRLDNFSQSMPPPPPGGSQIHTFAASLHFMGSVNGGASFTPSSAPAACVMRVTSLQDASGTRFFDTEMLALNVSLPTGVMVRESPSKASLGRTSIRQIPNSPNSPYRVSSFFDIFTELSIDGGQTWQPSLIAPIGLALQSIDPDNDHDGLPDAWEIANFGDLTSGPTGDNDRDGSTNGYEYLAGTSPVDPSSVLRPESKVSGLDLKIIFPTLNRHQYTIECSTDLRGSSWTPVVNGIEGDGTTRSIVLTNAISFQRRYYRVIPSLSP